MGDPYIAGSEENESPRATSFPSHSLPLAIASHLLPVNLDLLKVVGKNKKIFPKSG